jgi:lipopolysaccharide transport system ATP-binding protein
MGDRVIFVFELGADLGAGEYTLTVALHADKTHVEENYHWIERAKILKVLPSNDYEFIGVARLQPVCHLEFPN